MTKTFSFNNRKKNYLPVELSDDNKTTLLVGTPSKALYKRLEQLENDNTSVDELYDLCAQVLSHNKGGYTVTAKMLENLDVEDIRAFIVSYIEFIKSEYDLKN